jgi:hypothetical protein
MKYINYVLNAYILLVTMLPVRSQYILADLLYKISQEKRLDITSTISIPTKWQYGTNY